MNKLRLTAADSADLAVIASASQDAILRVGGIDFDKSGRALSMTMTRFQHESGEATRILSGLRFDGVFDVKTRGIDRSDKDAMLVLLNIDFVETDSPAGELTFVFSGDGELKASVECLDGILVDVNEPRSTDKMPLHPE